MKNKVDRNQRVKDNFVTKNVLRLIDKSDIISNENKNIITFIFEGLNYFPASEHENIINLLKDINIDKVTEDFFKVIPTWAKSQRHLLPIKLANIKETFLVTHCETIREETFNSLVVVESLTQEQTNIINEKLEPFKFKLINSFYERIRYKFSSTLQKMSSEAKIKECINTTAFGSALGFLNFSPEDVIKGIFEPESISSIIEKYNSSIDLNNLFITIKVKDELSKLPKESQRKKVIEELQSNLPPSEINESFIDNNSENKIIEEKEEDNSFTYDKEDFKKIKSLIVESLTPKTGFNCNELPKIEKFWRQWRDKNVSELDFIQKDFFKNKKQDELIYPNQSVLPSTVAHYYLTEKFNKNNNLSSYESHLYSFFANYRRTKSIWKIDVELINELSDLTWPGDTPSEALLHLPYDSAVFWSGKINDVVYWFDCVILNKEDDISKYIIYPTLNIALSDYNNNSIVPIVILVIKPNMTLTESVKMAVDMYYTDQNHEKLTKFEQEEEIKNLTQTVINILLYAAGNEDIIEKAGHKFAYSAKATRNAPKQETIKRDYESPKLFDVGIKFGNTIKWYKTQQELQKIEEQITGIKKSVSPHIRRAHAHLYWIGSKYLKKPIVKFLLPIPVNMNEIPSETNKIIAQRVI